MPLSSCEKLRSDDLVLWKARIRLEGFSWTRVVDRESRLNEERSIVGAIFYKNRPKAQDDDNDAKCDSKSARKRCLFAANQNC